jgi:nicotinate phosphoribosyltransferase
MEKLLSPAGVSELEQRGDARENNVEGRPSNLALLTDLYELTMAAAYHRQGMFAPATFSLFIREYPPGRGYFVNAGLADVLEYLESFHLETEDLD